MASPELSTIDSIAEIIKQVGFPIFVAGWFMLRTDRRLEALTETVNKMVKK